MTTIDADANNEWRLETPGQQGWTRSSRPDAEDKFFMASADGHVQEPNTFLADRLPEEYQARLPGIIQMPTEKGNASVDPDLYQKTEGFRPAKINWTKPLEGTDLVRNQGGRDPETRLQELALDGVDAEILFPNKGLTMWATPDAQFSHAMCRAYNDWVWEEYGPYNDRLAPMAAIAPAAIDEAMAEIQRVADLGFKGLSLPTKPVFGPPNVDDLNYNLKEFEPALGLPGGRRAPRHLPRVHRARSTNGQEPGWGGHQLRRALIGARPWSPWSTSAPRGWPSGTPSCGSAPSRPTSVGCPSPCSRWMRATSSITCGSAPSSICSPASTSAGRALPASATTRPGLLLARHFDLMDNFCWANDFPHHEGSWPYSAQTVERTMGHLDDGERAKVLGLNAARIFGLPIPERYRHHRDAAQTHGAARPEA